MLANPAIKPTARQSAEFKLPIPQACVRAMARRYVRSMLLYIAAGLAIALAVELLVRQPVSIVSLLTALPLI